MQTIGGRVPSRLPVTAYKTYLIAAPLSTHWRGPVLCSEYECDAWFHGWETHVDESTELGQRQAHYIRRESGRTFSEEHRESGLTIFRFEPGQEGFASRIASQDHSRHMVRLEREEAYIERGGDHHGTVGGRRVHKNPADWVDSFASNQDALITTINRG
jgi:hypothetical protein